MAHAFDISVALDRAIELAPDAVAGIEAAVATVCNDDTRAMGLVGDALEAAPSATDTWRLVAATGRAVR